MSGRVLVVEDDDDLLATLSALLTGQGFLVETARGAKEASERLLRDVPDVMVLDLFLNGRLCEDFIESLVDNIDAPPVVICSATHRVGDDLSSRYAIPFIAKPFDIDALLEAIEEAHRTHRRPSRSMRAISKIAP
jgi:DNA-binding NtrC family response regulator